MNTFEKLMLLEMFENIEIVRTSRSQICLMRVPDGYTWREWSYDDAGNVDGFFVRFIPFTHYIFELTKEPVKIYKAPNTINYYHSYYIDYLKNKTVSNRRILTDFPGGTNNWHDQEFINKLIPIYLFTEDLQHEKTLNS